jgi:ABC-2 type transport system permease protein
MMSPLFAKLMPDIIGGMEIEGIQITIPEPTAVDAYTQFFKNLTEIGMIVVLLVFGGTVSSELEKGTLINILAKGLQRSTVLLSKYSAAVMLWTVGYALSAVTAYGYTSYLFGNAAIDNLVFSVFCLWVFGCFVLALIFISSTIASGNFGGLILSAAALVIMIALGVIPGTDKYNPITLASKNMAILTGSQDIKELYVTLLITGILILLCMILSISLFKKKRL